MYQVVNFKQFGSVRVLNEVFGERWLYIGRANPYAGLTASPLANPFKVKGFGGQRGATLTHYRRWLWQRIQAGDEEVLKTLKAITPETVLVCWCKPEPCHGDVVKAAVAWMGKEFRVGEGVSGLRFQVSGWGKGEGVSGFRFQVSGWGNSRC